MSIEKQAQSAKEAGYILGSVGIDLRNAALDAIALGLEENIDQVIKMNAIDMNNAKISGISTAMQDRLMLSEERVRSIAESVRQITNLPDVLGEVERMWERPNGLLIGRKRVPLGLVGMIYEARPNVTVDASVLAIRTGNAVILRGGKEAINSNLEFVRIMKEALRKVGLPESGIEIISDTSRESAVEMMKLNQYIDVLIPRGSAGLIKSVVDNATVPVIETGAGNCHIYIDEFADIGMGLDILVDAKCSRPSLCNALETLLVHQKKAEEFLEAAKLKLEEFGVQLRGCDETGKIIACEKATDEDYFTEFNDLILAIKIVSNIDSAINHINKHGTKHSECIITNDYANSQKFLKLVDAAAVYVNASTWFSDGFEFGLGAEIGISTQKLHARGPMGMEALTSIKYIIYGNGQCRGKK